MGPFESKVETLYESVKRSTLSAVWNWIASAMESRGKIGPWMIKDMFNGHPRYSGKRIKDYDHSISYSDVEDALEHFSKKGLVKLHHIPAGMIEKFTITLPDPNGKYNFEDFV